MEENNTALHGGEEFLSKAQGLLAELRSLSGTGSGTEKRLICGLLTELVGELSQKDGGSHGVSFKLESTSDPDFARLDLAASSGTFDPEDWKDDREEVAAVKIGREVAKSFSSQIRELLMSCSRASASSTGEETLDEELAFWQELAARLDQASDEISGPYARVIIEFLQATRKNTVIYQQIHSLEQELHKNQKWVRGVNSFLNKLHTQKIPTASLSDLKSVVRDVFGTEGDGGCSAIVLQWRGTQEKYTVARAEKLIESITVAVMNRIAKVVADLQPNIMSMSFSEFATTLKGATDVIESWEA